MKKLDLGFPVEFADDLPTQNMRIGEYKLAYANGSQLIIAGLAIERDLVDIIAMFFCRNGGIIRDEFMNRILYSSWCNFDAKKKLFLEIVDNVRVLEKSDIQKVDSSIAKVIENRNAFAHGRIIAKNGSLYVCYYRGRAVERELNDQFWDYAEDCYKEAHRLIIKSINAFIKFHRDGIECRCER